MPTRPRGGGVPVGEGQVETVAHDGSAGGDGGSRIEVLARAGREGGAGGGLGCCCCCCCCCSSPPQLVLSQPLCAGRQLQRSEGWVAEMTRVNREWESSLLLSSRSERSTEWRKLPRLPHKHGPSTQHANLIMGGAAPPAHTDSFYSSSSPLCSVSLIDLMGQGQSQCLLLPLALMGGGWNWSLSWNQNSDYMYDPHCGQGEDFIRWTSERNQTRVTVMGKSLTWRLDMLKHRYPRFILPQSKIKSQRKAQTISSIQFALRHHLKCKKNVFKE